MQSSRLGRGIHWGIGLCVFGAIAASLSAQASGTSVDVKSLGSSSVSEGALSPKKFLENSEITDAKLRADAGSLSQYSLRFNLMYMGPPATNLSALNQPNPDGVVAPTATAITGTIGVRYRLDNASSVSFHAGLSDLYPFHAEQKLDVSNPGISYDQSFNLAGVQILSAPGVSLVTQDVYRSKGGWLGLRYAISAVYSLGKTGFAAGSEALLGYYLFNREVQRADGKIRDLNLILSPFLKYNVSDRFNVNTALGFTLYHLRTSARITDIASRAVTQKLGVGYAFTRDVYVSPYLTFYPSKPRLDTTTVNMSTSFSVL